MAADWIPRFGRRPRQALRAAPVPGGRRRGPGHACRYHFPASLPLGGFALSGACTDHAQEATAGSGAELELGFLARDVYLVLGGSGMLGVWVDGHHTQTIDVAGVPRLYTPYQAGSSTAGTLLLRPAPGVQAYDFTFG